MFDNSKHIVLLGVGILTFICCLFISQPDSAETPTQKQITISHIIDQSIKRLTTTIKNIEHITVSEKLRIAQQLEFDSTSIFVYDSNDSLIFWSGEKIIKNLDDNNWQYSPSTKDFCHHFQIKKHKIITCFNPDPYFLSSNGKDIITNEKSIKKIVSLPNKYIRLLLNVFYLFLILFFCYLALYKVKINEASNREIFFNIIVLSLVGVLIFGMSFNASILLWNVMSSQVITLSLSLLLLTIFLVFQKRPKHITSNNKLIFHAAITGVMVAAYVKVTELILNPSNNLNFEEINFSSANQFLFASSAIISLFTIWVYFRNAFSGNIENWSHRVIKLICLVTCYILAGLFLEVSLPYLFAILFLTIYYFTADLYYEIKEPNVTWIIWWVILNAAFLASNLYYTSIKNNIIATQEAIQSVYQESSNSIVSDLSIFCDQVNSSQLFSKIGELPENAKLSENDIKSFIANASESDLSSYKLYYFLNDGTSGLLKQQSNKEEFLSQVTHYNKVSAQIKFDPFSGNYLLSFTANEHFYILKKSENKNDILDGLYGIFQDGNYIYGKINELPSFPAFTIPSDTIITSKTNSHIFHKPTGKTLIYTKKTYASLLRPISLFSLFFCLSILLLFIISLLNNKFQLSNELPLFFDKIKSLRLRIQLVILALILLSFVAIAWITSFYFNRILKNSKEKEITTKIVSINNALQRNLQNVYDLQSAHNIIENEISKLSAINDTEAKFYKLSGFSDDIQTSPYPFYPFLNYKFGKSQKPMTTLAPDGSVKGFFPLRNTNLGLVGFISLRNNLVINNRQQNLSGFLSSILNLYVFLFLIAGAIAIAVSRSITRPLKHLSDRINSIKVGKKNNSIEWQSEDEIGELIGNYNEMVEKLDVNIQLLAKTERDMAWREMAKQVAHEIKNPLTPMKLSIQYLQQAIQRNPERSEALIEKTSATLIEQIDNLTEIANAFANLASLPNADNEKIILNEVVDAVHDLFRKRDDMQINLLEPLEEIIVFADKGHLVRILNNIVKNAIQSIPEDRTGEITIKLYKEDGIAKICVSDNGTGIPDHLKDKIFTPKFTTKTSGSGLGLAIAANMLESFNGKIYFETEYEKGTQFYIEIPLMRAPKMKDDITRVNLD